MQLDPTHAGAKPVQPITRTSVIALVLVACGTNDAELDDGRVPVADAEVDARIGDAGCVLACNHITNAALEITEIEVAAALPIDDAIGGTIGFGTYVLTEITWYSGASGETGPTPNRRRQTLELTAGDPFDASVMSARVSNGGATQRRNYYLTGSSTSLEVHEVCPQREVTSARYSATATTLTIYDPTNSRVEVFSSRGAGRPP